MAAETAETWISGDDVGRTFDCQTPNCDGDASAKWGRHAYCRRCQVERGTRREDGSFVAGPVPAAPGSRERPRKRFGVPGRFEAAGLELARAGRTLDEAIALAQAAREAVPHALDGWHSAVEAMPKAPTSTGAATVPDDDAGCL